MDEIEVYATDEHGRHITRHIVGDPPATDHTVIATAELEQLRFNGQNADTLRKDNAQLREEVTRLRINAEKDVCSGCMQREEQRDHWIEASRQNGVAAEQAKQAWYREKDRAEHAEAAIERVRRFSELVINGSIRVQAIHQARDTLTVLDGEELKDPVIEAKRDEAEQRIGRLTDQLVAERERRRGAETAINRVRHLEEVYARSSATSHNAHSRIVYGIVRDDMRAILNGGYGDDITARTLDGKTP